MNQSKTTIFRNRNLKGLVFLSPIDERQITHLICARLKYDLYDFLGVFWACFLFFFLYKKALKHPLRKSYRSYFRRAQIRWVIWRSSTRTWNGGNGKCNLHLENGAQAKCKLHLDSLATWASKHGKVSRGIGGGGAGVLGWTGAFLTIGSEPFPNSFEQHTTLRVFKFLGYCLTFRG